MGDYALSTTNGDQYSPYKLAMKDIRMENGLTAIAPGEDHTCGVDGQGTVLCWGRVDLRLGSVQQGAWIAQGQPVNTSGIQETVVFESIGSGVAFSCGLSDAGKVYCWGTDDQGQMGNPGVNLGNPYPTLVQTGAVPVDEQFTHVAVGDYHICGRTQRRQIYCWGYNNNGQLGDTTTTLRQLPVASNLSSVLGTKSAHFLPSATSSSSSNCMIGDVNKLPYCWGYNNYGQLGVGDGTNRSKPTPVITSNFPANLGFKLIAVGEGAGCAVGTDNSLWCWGTNTNLAAGLVSSTTPRAMDLSNVTGSGIITELVMGRWHGCFLMQEGDAYCWGYNGDYRTGTSDSTANFGIPKKVDTSRVDGVKKFRSIAINNSSSCAITWMGLPYCWGNDDTYVRLGGSEFGGKVKIPGRVTMSHR
jgi:alpha-tubulin suppressor-like RCC1 family protein